MAEARNASLAQQSAVNVSSLILDLHRNPPAFDTVVRLSWIDEETESLPPKEGRTSNWTSEETDSFLGVILEHGQAILKPGNGKAIAMQKKMNGLSSLNVSTPSTPSPAVRNVPRLL